MSPVGDGLVTNAPAVTGAHGHAPDAHVVHDGVGRHRPDQSEALYHDNISQSEALYNTSISANQSSPVVGQGPVVVMQVEGAGSKPHGSPPPPVLG